MDLELARTAQADQPSPITERVLHRLGRPRWLWIVLWSLVPLISPFLFATAVRISGPPLDAPEFVDLTLTQVVLAYACFVLLVGVGLLARQASDAQRAVATLVGAEPAAPFAGIGSAVGPLVLTAVVAAVVSAGGWVTYGPVPPLAALMPLVIYLVPILTFVWVYLAILVDLDRLGRRPLALDRFPEDRTLGLDELGSLASTGLGILLLATVPIMFVGADEPVTLGISLAIVGLIVGIFVLSMGRLHRQMVAAKKRYVGLAERLYAEAYAPIRNEPGVATMESQATALRVAQSLDERAHGLPTWPIDEGTLRFTAVVITGVVTSLVGRALFAALGF